MALALATVTLTGYAIQQKRLELFLVAAVVPFFAVLFDVFVKYRFATPFLYKAASIDFEVTNSESTSLLFLDYGKGEDSEYRKIFSLPSGPERQRRFRSKYARDQLWLKLLLCLAAAMGELILGLLFR